LTELTELKGKNEPPRQPKRLPPSRDFGFGIADFGLKLSRFALTGERVAPRTAAGSAALPVLSADFAYFS
jgi:hypothetical protein